MAMFCNKVLSNQPACPLIVSDGCSARFDESLAVKALT
jgi:hypothetical protein